MLVAGVLDAAVVQVLVELRLMDGVDRAEPHRHGGELPELLHEPRMRIGGQRERLAVDHMTLLLAEAVEALLADPALDVGAGVHPGRGVPLEEDLVAAAGMVLASEEVVHADLVERGRRGVAGDMATYADRGALRAMHQHRGVPPDQAAERPLHLLIAGEPRLLAPAGSC